MANSFSRALQRAINDLADISGAKEKAKTKAKTEAKPKAEEPRERHDSEKIRDAINKKISQYKIKDTRLEAAMREIREYLVHEIIPRRFAEGDAGKWPPLAEVTQENRLELGYGGDHPILIRTGGLFSQVTDEESWKIQINTMGDKHTGTLKLLVNELENSPGGGDTMPGGQFLMHQYGSLSGSVPARPMVPEMGEGMTQDLYPDEQDYIKSILLKYFGTEVTE